MVRAFYNEELVRIEGEPYRLVIDFAAIDAAEALLGQSYDTVIAEITSKSPEPRASVVGKVVWGMLRRHHPEVTIDQVATMMYGSDAAAIGAAMGNLIQRAFNTAEEPEAKGKNPRKPRGASKPS